MKPLTIEQLRALKVGDWVWGFDSRCEKSYYLLKGYNEECYESYFSAPNGTVYSYLDYGKTWLAWKNKEQAETKGEIVELPCETGDTVYCVEYFCNYKGCSEQEQSYCCGCMEMIEREKKNEKYIITEKKFALRDFSQIGKKYFINKSEAETRLAELKGEK